MNWDAAMDQIAARLETMEGLRRYEDGQNPTPPCAIVSYPEEIDPHGTYNRGIATATLQVMMLMGPVIGRQIRKVAAKYVNDGPTGVTTVLESGVDAGAYPAFDDLTVTRISFGAVEIKAVPFMAAFVDLVIAGQGIQED